MKLSSNTGSRQISQAVSGKSIVSYGFGLHWTGLDCWLGRFEISFPRSCGVQMSTVHPKLSNLTDPLSLIHCSQRSGATAKSPGRDWTAKCGPFTSWKPQDGLAI